MLLISITASSPLNPLLEKMSNTVYMTGSFIQIDTWALTLDEEVSSGTMYIAQPDLFLLSYTEPEGSRIGYDGSVLYTVEPDLEHADFFAARLQGLDRLFRGAHAGAHQDHDALGVGSAVIVEQVV